MPVISNRIETSLTKTKRPTSGKIIFISCEGQVTEEEYFEMISNLFSGIKSKIQFISVMEDILSIPSRHRTAEQTRELTKSKPWQLVEKIDKFKTNEENRYDFSNHPEDEFWIISDVDDNTNPINIQKWNQMLEDCSTKQYGCAISNPFFEFWLLLHHVDAEDSDFNFAVTNNHPYEKTTHYTERLTNDANAPLRQKHISSNHYNIEKVKAAINRAKTLHNGETQPWPSNLGSTVYLLLEKVVEIADSITIKKDDNDI